MSVSFLNDEYSHSALPMDTMNRISAQFVWIESFLPEGMFNQRGIRHINKEQKLGRYCLHTAHGCGIPFYHKLLTVTKADTRGISDKFFMCSPTPDILLSHLIQVLTQDCTLKHQDYFFHFSNIVSVHCQLNHATQVTLPAVPCLNILCLVPRAIAATLTHFLSMNRFRFTDLQYRPFCIKILN